MANKTVSNLNELTTVSNSDVLLVETAAETMKVTKENLLKEVNEQLNAKSNANHTHNEYVTESELNNKGLATETFVTNKIAEAQLGVGDVDLSAYVKKDVSEYIEKDEVTGDEYIVIRDGAETKRVKTSVLKESIMSKESITFDMLSKDMLFNPSTELPPLPNVPNTPTNSTVYRITDKWGGMYSQGITCKVIFHAGDVVFQEGDVLKFEFTLQTNDTKLHGRYINTWDTASGDDAGHGKLGDEARGEIIIDEEPVDMSRTITLTSTYAENLKTTNPAIAIFVDAINNEEICTYDIYNLKLTVNDSTVITKIRLVTGFNGMSSSSLKIEKNPDSTAFSSMVQRTALTPTQILCNDYAQYIESKIATLGNTSNNSTSSSNEYAAETVITFGDSITASSYPNYIKQYLGCIIINKGSSGSDTNRFRDIIMGTGSYNAIDYSDVKAVTMMIGHNGGITGSLEDYTLTEGQTYLDYPTTGYGNIGKSIEYIQEQNPNTRIYICTLHKTDRGGVGEAANGTSKSSSNKLKEIAAHYGLPVIDVYSECGIGWHNYKTYATDGTHPNEDGHKLIGTYIAKQMLSK